MFDVLISSVIASYLPITDIASWAATSTASRDAVLGLSRGVYVSTDEGCFVISSEATPATVGMKIVHGVIDRYDIVYYIIGGYICLGDEKICLWHGVEEVKTRKILHDIEDFEVLSDYSYFMLECWYRPDMLECIISLDDDDWDALAGISLHLVIF